MSTSSNSANGVTLQWKLSPIQREFFESDKKHRTLLGGRRFGKNVVGIASEIDYALQPGEYRHGTDNPEDCVVWWVAPTYSQAKKYGFQKALDVIPTELIRGKPKETIPFEIELINGAVMEFYSYDSPKSLDGAGVDSMTIDERGYMDDAVYFNNLAPMLLDTDGRVAFIGKPWPSEHFRECFDRGQSTDAEDKEFAAWRATSFDNPFIPDSRIDQLFDGLPERVYNREVLAQWDAGGSVLTADMLNHIPREDLPDREMRFTLGVDIGVEADTQKAREDDTDYWAVALVAGDPVAQDLYLVDVFQDRGLTLQEGVEWVRQLVEPVPNATIYVESNQAQRWFVQEADGKGLNVEPVVHTTPKQDRIVQLSLPFQNGTVRLVDPPEADADRWNRFRQQWQEFPGADHDDLLDAVEIAVNHADVDTHSVLGADPYGKGDAGAGAFGRQV